MVPGARPAVQSSKPEADELFPLRFYKQFKDLQDREIPVFEETSTILFTFYASMIVMDHFYDHMVSGRTTTNMFFETLLGETQAPTGLWEPYMAAQGWIPHLDDVIAALDDSVSRDIRDLYWQLTGLPDNKEEWVCLEGVTQADNPMLTVAAQAAWGANDTWRKLEAEGRQWLLWKFLKEHAPPRVTAEVQGGGGINPIPTLEGGFLR